jgi:type VI secretion system protein VasD
MKLKRLQRQVQSGVLLVVAWAISSALVLGGCSSSGAPPVQPAPSAVSIAPISVSFESSADTNPDPRGRPSPILLRFYELDAIGSFNSADFVGLFEREQATLGNALLARQELQLTPGQRTQSRISLKPGTRFIAVAAAFRDLERANWRAVLDVQGKPSASIKVRLNGRSVRLENDQ